SQLEHGKALAAGLQPNPQAMAAALAAGQGLIHAEALSFRLAETMPRPEAQAAVKALCQSLDQTHLAEATAAAYPDLEIADIFDPAQQLGQAPAEARAFAAASTAN
ncbi:MAG: adenylosuccinate lyase family protein, partial [Pseudomonadota bacterium]|nr:adenylosuccinate lyase family protein [Pseudomonadota bacterium]